MKNLTNSVLSLSLLLTTLPGFASASPRDDGSSSLHVDLETDPLAFAMGGYSLHVGIGWERLRLDLGAFAMDLPAFVHGNDGFDSSFDGFGFKLQYFLFDDQRGGFVGAGAGVNRTLIERKGTELAAAGTEFTVGANLGWRFDLPAGFYATPWIGFDYAFADRNTSVGGETYEQGRWTIFPTVHVGYQFQ